MIHVEPVGKKSHITIKAPVLGDGKLLLQCFENFLEYGLGSEEYDWERDGNTLAYRGETGYGAAREFCCLSLLLWVKGSVAGYRHFSDSLPTTQTYAVSSWWLYLRRK